MRQLPVSGRSKAENPYTPPEDNPNEFRGFIRYDLGVRTLVESLTLQRKADVYKGDKLSDLSFRASKPTATYLEYFHKPVAIGRSLG